MVRGRGYLLALAVAIGVGAALVAWPARAAGPWYVTTTGSDDHDCLSPSTPCATVNGAIGKASPGDTIRVAVGVYTSTDFFVAEVNKEIFLSGGWDPAFVQQTGLSTLDGQNRATPLSIGCYQPQGTGEVVISRFEIKSAASPRSGVAIWCAARAHLDQVKIHDNPMAGITNGAVLTVTRSEISDNGFGPGNTSDGIYNSGAITIENSTIHHNYGSGLLAYFGSTSALINVTATENGIGVHATSSVVRIRDSILAGNPGGDCIDTVPHAPSVQVRYSLVQENSGCDFRTAILEHLDPKLGPLQPNGGATSTRAAVGASPILQAGTLGGCVDALGAPLTVDQRGAPRGGRCDLGAYSAVVAVLKAVSGSGQPGGAITYTLTLSNPTGADFTQVHLQDALPEPLILMPESANATEGLVETSGNTLRWTGTLGSGTPTVVTVAATVPVDAPHQIITNTASAEWGGFLSPSNPAVFDTLQRLHLPAVADQHCADFSDDFATAAGGWALRDTALIRQELLNGEYRFMTRQGGFLFLAAAPTCLRLNYAVEVDARWASASGDSALGLAFGGTRDLQASYLVTLDVDHGTFTLYRRDPSSGLLAFLSNMPASPINPGTAVNHLKITRRLQPDGITVEINGTPVWTTYDSTYTGLTAVGLMVMNPVSMPVVDARFDNFRVVQAP